MHEQTDDKNPSIIPNNKNVIATNIIKRQALSLDFSPRYTTGQVDEMMSQSRLVIQNLHDENKQKSWDSKFTFSLTLMFIFGFSALVLIIKPDLFDQVLSFLAGAFGGGLGGYGLALKEK